MLPCLLGITAAIAGDVYGLVQPSRMFGLTNFYFAADDIGKTERSHKYWALNVVRKGRVESLLFLMIWSYNLTDGREVRTAGVTGAHRPTLTSDLGDRNRPYSAKGKQRRRDRRCVLMDVNEMIAWLLEGGEPDGYLMQLG